MPGNVMLSEGKGELAAVQDHPVCLQGALGLGTTLAEQQDTHRGGVTLQTQASSTSNTQAPKAPNHTMVPSAPHSPRGHSGGLWASFPLLPSQLRGLLGDHLESSCAPLGISGHPDQCQIQPCNASWSGMGSEKDALKEESGAEPASGSTRAPRVSQKNGCCVPLGAGVDSTERYPTGS